ncbi:MAG: HAMP domain-containing histidine kinase [Kaiparowitsia implicata GSE-PSE-MK54-09C]|nr:HAMP domain-containing histidine kinase [Kaiparowitsia implicata GSE-PSE-MK54-09C]
MVIPRKTIYGLVLAHLFGVGGVCLAIARFASLGQPGQGGAELGSLLGLSISAGLLSFGLSWVALRRVLHAVAVPSQPDPFSADAAHELRSPLAAILSNAQVALIEAAGAHEAASPESRQRLHTIRDTAQQMSRLLDDLLWLARHDAGQPLEEPTLLDLGVVLADVAEEYEPRCHRVGITLEWDLPPQQMWVQANAMLLHQMVSNIMDNACRYTPAGGRIQLEVLPTIQNIVVQIRDSGTGISPDALPHIFDRFHRGDEAKAPRTAGTGLGLAIAQRIITAHQGTLTADSTLGEGTTFTLQLPLHPLPSASPSSGEGLTSS